VKLENKRTASVLQVFWHN